MVRGVRRVPGAALLRLLLVAAVLAAWSNPLPALAAEIDTQPYAACDDTARLASVIQAEAYSQPDAAHVAIAQIVANEAARRGMTVCQLTAQTWFVSVYQYAMRHPHSWTMRQFTDVQPWAMDIASIVLRGDIPDATRGARHFDGAPCGAVRWTVGGVYFCD